MFIKQTKERTGWGKWGKVNTYRCDTCGKEYRLSVNWSGGTPPDGIHCPHCEAVNSF